jgi:hypothetical protein
VEQAVVTAAKQKARRILAGRGEPQMDRCNGPSEALTVLLRKIASFGDPLSYALQLVAEKLAKSDQPLVPERVFIGGGGDGGSNGRAGQW